MNRMLWPGPAVSAVTLLILLQLLTACGQSASPPSDAPALKEEPTVGARAPAFAAAGPDGEISLAQFAGRPVILFFYASWCTSCPEEARLLAEWQQRLAASDVVLVAIAVRDSADAAAQALAEAGLVAHLGLDRAGRVARDYRVLGPPATFFIDAAGVVQGTVLGPLQEEQLQHNLSLVTEAS